jgi:hypothetical protein
MHRLATQRTPRQFRVKDIKASRELVRDASYAPDFINVPITLEEVRVRLTDDDAAMLDGLVQAGGFGADRSEALRWAFHHWWIKRYMQGPKHLDHQSSGA